MSKWQPRRIHTHPPRPVARAPCGFGSLGACPGHNYGQPYYGRGCLFLFLNGTLRRNKRRSLRWSRGSDPRLLRLTMGGLLDRHNWGATPCIKDRPARGLDPSILKPAPEIRNLKFCKSSRLSKPTTEQFKASRFGKGPAPKGRGRQLGRPIRLSLPRLLRYADSRDGLGGMPDRSPAHICGGPPKYLRQKSPERDTRF
jgi:hypothetical protein